ncbi:hypothetical protein NEPAR05_0823 [Nematocida parisii]|nr:hypothetical protein NEPAR05_0823 [Nematocida parisii]
MKLSLNILKQGMEEYGNNKDTQNKNKKEVWKVLIIFIKN